MLRFLIADKNNMARIGMNVILKENFKGCMIYEAYNAQGIRENLGLHSIDLVVLEIDIPGADYPLLLNEVSSRTKILVFTSFPEDVFGPGCIKAGAHGFLRKTAQPPEIVRAIIRILDGRKYVSDDLYSLLLDQRLMAKNNPASPFEQLSSREMEICLLLQKGTSIRHISDLLHISYSTANTYKRRIFAKLNIHNLVSLVKLMTLHHVGKESAG